MPKGNYGSLNKSPAKVVDNAPASSVSQALANAKAQVDQAK